MSVSWAVRVRRTNTHTETQTQRQTDDVKTITPDTSQTWGIKRDKIYANQMKKGFSGKQYKQREEYPQTRICCSNVGCVLAETIRFKLCKHEVYSRRHAKT